MTYNTSSLSRMLLGLNILLFIVGAIAVAAIYHLFTGNPDTATSISSVAVGVSFVGFGILAIYLAITNLASA